MDEWQRFVLEVGLGERADGSWAASDVDLIASRQNGKNGGIEARELFGLVLLGEWFIHTSHLFTTTKESYARLLALVEADPDVKDRLEYAVASPASGYEMRFRGGGRIKFIARSRTSGRGLTGDVLVFDEAQDLSDEAQGALLPVVSARSNPQVWRMGSAPGPDAVVWQRRRKNGRAGGSPRLAFFEFSAEPDASLDDREAWAQANPGLGIRISEEAIEAERLAMSDEMFARERLSISAEINDGDGVFPEDKWSAACGDHAVAQTGAVFAVDVNPERSYAAIAAADALGRCEIIDHRPGTGWVVAELQRLLGRWGKVVGVDGNSPAVSIADELERAGATVHRLGGKEMASACAGIYDAVVNGTVRFRRDPALDAAAAGAKKRQAGDVWYWARRDATVDVSPLVAVTVARWLAGERQPGAPRVVNLADLLDDDDWS